MSKGAYIGVNGVARKIKKMFVGLGYANNILSNGALKTSTTGWTISSYCSATQNDGFCTIKVTGETGTGTFPNTQIFNKISGNTENTKQVIYCCAKVRGKNTNVSYPRVYVRYYKDGSTTAAYYNLSEINGLTGTSLNDGNWHTLSIRLVTYDDSGYYDFDRIAFGISTSTTGDTMDIKEVFVCNLTETYGRGNEPTKEWCDQKLTTYAEKIITETSLAKAHNIKKGYIGVNGIARKFYEATTPTVWTATYTTFKGSSTGRQISDYGATKASNSLKLWITGKGETWSDNIGVSLYYDITGGINLGGRTLTLSYTKSVSDNEYYASFYVECLNSSGVVFNLKQLNSFINIPNNTYTIRFTLNYRGMTASTLNLNFTRIKIGDEYFIGG